MSYKSLLQNQLKRSFSSNLCLSNKHGKIRNDASMFTLNSENQSRFIHRLSTNYKSFSVENKSSTIASHQNNSSLSNKTTFINNLNQRHKSQTGTLLEVPNVLPDEPIILYGDIGYIKNTSTLFRPDKKILVFGVCGAFLPTDTEVHLQQIKSYLPEIRKRNIDLVAVISVNDPWTLQTWRQLNLADEINMYADPEAEFTKHIGMELDLSVAGLGTRSKRYSMFVDNQKAIFMNVEDSPLKVDYTSPQRILTQIDRYLGDVSKTKEQIKEEKATPKK